MKKILNKIFLSIITLSAFLVARSASAAVTDNTIIYFITGAPVDIQPKQITDAEKILSSFIAANFPHASFTVEHNSKWKDICKTIIAEEAKTPGQKIILLGHSYGAQSGITVSHCLEAQKLSVDRLITMDTIQKLFDQPAGVVPENVSIEINFYETSDPFLDGITREHRADNSSVGITNTEIKIVGGSSPHFDLVKQVVGDGTIQNALFDAMNAP